MQLTLRAVPKASLTNPLIVFTTLRRIWILTCCQWPDIDTTFAHRDFLFEFFARGLFARLILQQSFVPSPWHILLSYPLR
jgi:hypothetical protein